MSTIIKQFTNRKKQKIAGKTPEHAVYDENGVRLDYKLKSLTNNIITIPTTATISAVKIEYSIYGACGAIDIKLMTIKAKPMVPMMPPGTNNSKNNKIIPAVVRDRGERHSFNLS